MSSIQGAAGPSLRSCPGLLGPLWVLLGLLACAPAARPPVSAVPPAPAEPAPQQTVRLPGAGLALPWVHRDIHAVAAAAQTAEGVWVGTVGGGVLRFTQPGRPPIQRFGVVDGLPSDDVVSLVPWGAKRIAVGTTAGLATIEELAVVAHPALPPGEEAVTALVADPEGRLWVGWGGGLGQLGRDGAPVVALAGVSVTDLAVDAAGDLWVATATSGVLHVAGRFAERFDPPHGLATAGVERLLTTAVGEVLALGTLAEGRDRFSLYDGERWHGFRVVQERARWQLLDLAVMGTRWLALSNFGARALQPERPSAAVAGPAAGARAVDSGRPRVEALQPPPAPAAPPPEASPRTPTAPSPIHDELPPFVRRVPHQDSLLAASEQAATEAVEAARSAYFRASAERQALRAELMALELRSQTARERSEALERRLVESKLGGAAPAQNSIIAADLEAARLHARDAGVAAELARVRSKRLDAEVGAQLTAVLREQRSYDTLAEQITPTPAPPVAEPSRPAADPLAGLPREDLLPRPAPFPGRGGRSAAPALALVARAGVPMPEVAPAQVTLWRGDSAGLWVGTRSAGLLRLQGTAVQEYAAGDLVPLGPAQGPLVDGEGAVWVVGPHGDVLRHDGARWEAVSLGLAAGEAPTSGRACALSTDDQGRVIVALERDGGLSFVRRVAAGWQPGRSWPLLRTRRPVVIKAFAVDTDGRRWLALALRDGEGELAPVGLVSLDPAEAAAVWHGQAPTKELLQADVQPRAVLPSNTITALAVAGKTVWVGTPSGLVRLMGQDVRVFDENDDLEIEYVRALAVTSAGALWLAAGNGVATLVDGARCKTTRLPGGERAEALFPGPDGSVWASTAAGILRRDGEAWVSVPLIGVSGGAARHVAFDGEGRAWLLRADRLLATQRR